MGKSSYQVLSYHQYVGEKGDVNTQVHKLEDGSRNGEYYMIENGALVIHTRMFSTFAIAAVYKIHVSWGNMLFEYNTAPQK